MSIIFDDGNKSAKAGTELMMLYLQEHIDKDLLSQFSIGRAIKLFDDNTKKIYWCHNIPGQRMPPEVSEVQTLSSKDRWSKLDSVAFVSEWQRQRYISHFNFNGDDIKRTTVLKNAIVPIEEHKKPNDKIRLIYTSVPFRGLEVLAIVFEELCKKHSDIQLEVFSSLKLYGAPENSDRVYESLYNRLRSNPKVIYHGTKSNAEVREGFKRSHIFAYPCNYQETSCISLIEAMSASCLCVHSDLAALPETSGGHTMMYKFDRTRQIESFALKLEEAINAIRSGRIDTTEQKKFADDTYSWDNRIVEWNNYLRSL